MTKRISHPVQFAKLFCKRLTAAVLILLLIAMFIPSAIALGNDSPILPDADIPETLTRAQLEAHGAVARLREENDEFTFVYLNAETAIGFTIRKASNSYNLYCKCKL